MELAIAAFATTACTVPKNGTVGAAVSFYDFILLGGTHHPRYEGKIGGVLDLAWDTGESLDDHPYWFKGVPLSPFLMEITGYYKALLTGIYTITTKLNDSATILVGAGVAFDCGNQHKNFIAKKFSLTGSGVNKIPGPFYMRKDYYYPFRIEYANF